ncbi:hypothetical protein EJ08DRAFT_112926 [Tothia fuscella]|uniref:Uncharacterized protein n=1 Tax=Tothia fuscella TaxID=1048955 RepID=A0A9P4NWU7_9PEZI|nr:hypothetical protein EJ08DRAFT_112926 [Tothia fuscella]
MAEEGNTAQPKPAVFILDLEQPDLFTAIYSDFVDALASEYRIQRARKKGPAERYLTNTENRPIAILAVDAGLVERKNASLLQQVRDYVHRGGTVIFMANFSGFITPPKMNKFWPETWGLDWQFGEYHRTTVHLNHNMPWLSTATNSLPQQYSQKAVNLAQVALSDVLYRPSSDSRTQSAVLAESPVNQYQTPVAFTKIGRGFVGYIGDMNNETGSQNVVMEMCKLAAYNASTAAPPVE